MPSIIYGLLGLGLFVRAHADWGAACWPARRTLALLALPVVILSTREALRAVPKSIREASYALGRHEMADDPAPGAAAARRPAS